MVREGEEEEEEDAGGEGEGPGGPGEEGEYEEDGGGVRRAMAMVQHRRRVLTWNNNLGINILCVGFIFILGVARYWQNVVVSKPPHPSFFL